MLLGAPWFRYSLSSGETAKKCTWWSLWFAASTSSVSVAALAAPGHNRKAWQLRPAWEGQADDLPRAEAFPSEGCTVYVIEPGDLQPKLL